METRSIAFKCIVDDIHSSICPSHVRRDVLSVHAHSSIVPKERSIRDLRQPSTRTKLVQSMCFTCQRSMFIIIPTIVYVRKCGGKRTFRLPRSMKVKVVRLSKSHVMILLSLPSPERTPETTANEMRTRGIKEKHISSCSTRSHCF